MSEVAIQIKGLGKRYRIGSLESHNMFRDALVAKVRSPFRRLASIFNGKARNGSLQQDNIIWALKDIDLEIKTGEVVGLIGSNGAGKTTLLKILSRITDPTEGTVIIRGRVGSLLEVGTGFHPELTGRENIYLNGAILGMKKPEIERKFHEIVAFAEIEKFIDTPVKHYSSGMYVRLAFSVAAHLEPDILLVDEVLAVGDAAFQKKCLGKMNEVSRQGRTVVFVSHNMETITSLCHRGILLREGMIEKDDAVDRTVAEYLSSLREYQMPVEGKIPLVDHPGRLKDYEGLVRLTYCKLLNRDDEPETFFKSGDEIKVAIGYKMNFPVENGELVFTLIVADMMQRRVFGCSNEFVEYKFDRLESSGEIQCVIPKLPLVPGNYTVTLACRVGSVWSDGVYDAARFEVLHGDFYGTMRLPTSSMGPTIVEHYWSDAVIHPEV